MMKRRKFVSHSSLAMASLFLLRCRAEKTKAKIEELSGKQVGDFGLQLWSVRYLMDEDPIGTLSKLAAIGFKEIEGTGDCYKDGNYFGIEKTEFKKILDDLGLRMNSIHTPGTGRNSTSDDINMTHNWERYCSDAAEMGVESVILAWLEEGEREMLDDFKYTIDLLGKCADTAAAYGLKMAYHNHDFEFYPIDGQVPYDLMLEQTDPSKVNFEMDHYWVAFAGADSLDYFGKYPGRFSYWHVKDMSDSEDKFFAPVGTGVIDYKKIFAAESLSGMQKFYVEQDEYRSYTPLEAMRISHDYLKGMVY